MGLTTFRFLIFFLSVLAGYYVLPKKCRWICLFVACIVYYLLANNPTMILYPVLTIGITYTGALVIHHTSEQRRKKIILSIVVIAVVGLLALLKYFNPGNWMVPLGISFYTFTLLGYLFDVYYGMGEVEKNPFRLMLFGMFFANMISGPIMRYGKMKDTLFVGHAFVYQRVCFGCQRILWGFFQKLVISERLAVIVNAVFENPEEYAGGYVLLAVIFYTLQLYTDFAGCMDIVVGVGETLGIELPENFNHPFASTTIQEFWRRWHMTLGMWLKDYLFYPLLRTNFFMEMPNRLRERMGKKKAKQVTSFSAMLLLWITIGLWHGNAWHFVIGTGILQWIYIVTGELIEPYVKKICVKYQIDRNGRGYQCMQKVRTFLLMSFAFMIFRAPDMQTVKTLIRRFFCTDGWILWNMDFLQLGLDIYEWLILILSLFIFGFISKIENSKGNRLYVREIIEKKPIVLRWVIWYALLFYVILLGQYGPGYSASEFIYQGF